MPNLLGWTVPCIQLVEQPQTVGKEYVLCQFPSVQALSHAPIM